MPSVRVRRGSRYSSLLGEDTESPNSEIRGRPRSRTLVSIFQNRPPNLDTQQVASTSHFQSGQDESGNVSDSKPSPTSQSATSKVASSIRNPSLHAPLRGHRSFPGFYREDLQALSMGQRHSLKLEGSQADVIVPYDGTMGRIESTLSSTRSNERDIDLDEDSDDTHHDDDIVEHLDVIDPEISTVSNLANAANAILIPPIGVYSRKPVVFLSTPPARLSGIDQGKQGHEDDLDRHVQEVLGRRERIRRTLKGVWVFVKTPMGFITAVYGFLVVFWGAAIVLFLTKMINLHNPVTQGFWVEISSQIENALFTVTGVGLIPWRILDTYHILRIWHFKRLTRRQRRKAGLPVLYDEDDLPDPNYDPNYVHVLTDKQQAELHYHQRQFMESQTWYRPHGTTTHKAFPINTALLICLFVDGNSIFQCILCGCMWGLNRFDRPAWTTGSLIPLSFLCGILAAVFIWRGGQKTKRTKEVEERLRSALAMEITPNSYHAYHDAVAEEKDRKKEPQEKR